MKFGLSARFTGLDGRDHKFALGAAQLAEDIGFRTLWNAKYLYHVPVYESTYPYGGIGHDGPDALRGYYDPVVVLAAVAQVTSTIRLGTYPVIVAHHSPVALARTLATLDHMCDGRLDIGVGVGWSKEEYEALGVPFETRGRRTDEYLDAMVELWGEAEWSSYEGETVSFGPMHGYPKPIQRPHPPIVVTGNSPAALRRAARCGQGWAGVALDLEGVQRTVDDLRARLDAAGRTPDDFVFRIGRRVSTDASTWAADVEFIEGCEAAGIDEVVLTFPMVPVHRHEPELRALASALGVGAT